MVLALLTTAGHRVPPNFTCEEENGHSTYLQRDGVRKRRWRVVITDKRLKIEREVMLNVWPLFNNIASSILKARAI